MSRRLASYYLLTLSFFVGVLFVVLHFAPAGVAVKSQGPVSSVFASLQNNLQSPLAQALLQVVVIVAAARAAGYLFNKMGQPAVIGEMAIGIALGPSLLGSALPEVSKFVFPVASLGSLSILSQVGILLFMFIIGMELDVPMLRGKAQTALLISHASIVLPFLLGLLSSLFLYHSFAGSNKSYLAFALFMGISMSITAFPVLARIIRERGLVGTELGNTAITCAAIDDLTAWIALAFIVTIARAQSLASGALSIAVAGVFAALAFIVAKPALERALAKCDDPASPGKALTGAVLLFLFASAFATELAGIHAVFGAFLAGVAMPRDHRFKHFLTSRLEYLSTLLLVPIFFAFTGLRTQVGLLNSASDWLYCLLLVTIAIAGKYGGAMLSARATGMNWRDASAIGAFMNTRGLVELIALNIGLDLGVLSPKIFAMLVLMALITTFMTGPIIALLKIGKVDVQRLNAVDPSDPAVSERLVL